MVATPVFGERMTSWDDVRGLVASGEVDAVHVSNELLAGSTGYSVVTVHWRHGWLKYVTEVVQVRGPGGPEGAGTTDDQVVLRDPPSRLLASLQPGLQVTHDQNVHPGSNLFGWRVSNALGIPGLVLFLAGFSLLVAGPQPWRATRWAWFWLLVPPIGSIAFLLLSGPTTGVPGPRNPSRRLTGGWAFLLAFPLMAMSAPYRW
jgi:hypothetical protein